MEKIAARTKNPAKIKTPAILVMIATALEGGLLRWCKLIPFTRGDAVPISVTDLATAANVTSFLTTIDIIVGRRLG